MKTFANNETKDESNKLIEALDNDEGPNYFFSEQKLTSLSVFSVKKIVIVFFACLMLLLPAYFFMKTNHQEEAETNRRALLPQEYQQAIGYILRQKGPTTLFTESKREPGFIQIQINDHITYTLPFKKSTFLTFIKSDSESEENSQQKKDISELIQNTNSQYVSDAAYASFKKMSKHQRSLRIASNIQKKDIGIDWLQYKILNETYNLDQSVPQNNFCFLSPSRNLITRSGTNAFRLYLSSLESQNYSNFQVFLNDDASDDGSWLMMANIIVEEFPRMRNRVTIVKNPEKIGALGNRDITSRNYCKKGSIIAELDADDALLGKQVLNVMNRQYARDKQVWFVYSTFIQLKYEQQAINKGHYKNIKDLSFMGKKVNWKKFKASDYRTKIGYWGTSHFKTYLRELYIRVPIQYLFQNGAYHMLATDRFNVYAIVELAGQKRIRFIQQIFYLYRNLISPSAKCHYEFSYYKEYDARRQVPLRPLPSLSANATQVQNYSVPNEVNSIYKNYLKRYQNCMRRNNLSLDQHFKA